MSDVLDHPLVRHYLTEVEVSLSELAPDERAETIAGIREHLTDALPPGSTEAELRTELDRLGMPAPLAGAAAAAPALARSAPMSMKWVPAVVGALLAVAFALTVLGLMGTIGVISASSGTTCTSVVGKQQVTKCEQTQVTYSLSPEALLSPLFTWAAIALPMLAVVILVLISPLWARADKLLMTLTLPIVPVVVTVVPVLLLDLVGHRLAALSQGWVASGTLLIAALLLWRSVSRGLRAAT